MLAVSSGTRPDDSFDGDLEDFVRADRIAAVGALLLAAAAVLALIMVRQLTAAQRRAAGATHP